MTLAHAKALLCDAERVMCAPWRPEHDEVALQRLGAWASRRFSPLVAPDPPDGLLLDITGCARLFGGERRLRARLAGALEVMGFGAHVAIGPSVGCAWAIARFGSSTWYVDAGGERDALGPLPIEALRLEDETVTALHEVAIDRIEHVLDLPRDALVDRFGEGLIRRLDQALGLITEAIEPVRPRAPLEVERLFDGPTKQLEAILVTGRDLVVEMSGRLRARETGVMHLSATLLRADLDPLVHDIALSYPSRDIGHLWSLLRQRLEESHLGFGVEGVTLRAVREIRLEHEQIEQWSGAAVDCADADQSLGRFVDTVSGRLGWDAVRRSTLVESHLPERAVVLEPWRGGAKGKQQDVDGDERGPKSRPTVLFAEPEPIEAVAQAPEGPPALVRIPRWHETSVEVRKCFGPERIAWEWWKPEVPGSPNHGTRDYYVIEDEEGRWSWVYRHLETGRWYVQGEWA